MQRRRLVINMGGAKSLGHKYWGQKFGENIFSENILNAKKFFYPQQFLMTFFSWLHFSRLTPFVKNLFPFHPDVLTLSLYFFFLSLCFCKIKKFSSDYWGGQKRGFAPHLNYWGRVPGLPPESTPMHVWHGIVKFNDTKRYLYVYLNRNHHTVVWAFCVAL